MTIHARPEQIRSHLGRDLAVGIYPPPATLLGEAAPDLFVLAGQALERVFAQEHAETAAARGPLWNPLVEAMFDETPPGTPVSFVRLPIALQYLLGSSAVDVLYHHPDVPEWTPPVTAIRLATSTWTRRRVKVREMVRTLFTPYAREAVWAHPRLRTTHQTYPRTVGTSYLALAARGTITAPLIMLDGHWHETTPLYLIALARFADADADVSLLEGTTHPERMHDILMDLPPAPRSWRHDGLQLMLHEETLSPADHEAQQRWRAQAVAMQQLPGDAAVLDHLHATWRATGHPAPTTPHLQHALAAAGNVEVPYCIPAAEVATAKWYTAPPLSVAILWDAPEPTAAGPVTRLSLLERAVEAMGRGLLRAIPFRWLRPLGLRDAAIVRAEYVRTVHGLLQDGLESVFGSYLPEFSDALAEVRARLAAQPRFYPSLADADALHAQFLTTMGSGSPSALPREGS